MATVTKKLRTHSCLLAILRNFRTSFQLAVLDRISPADVKCLHISGHAYKLGVGYDFMQTSAWQITKEFAITTD